MNYFIRQMHEVLLSVHLITQIKYVTFTIYFHLTFFLLKDIFPTCIGMCGCVEVCCKTDGCKCVV